MIVQLHRQSITDPNETVFVEQSPDLPSHDEFEVWIREMRGIHQDDELPDGWGWMVCTSEYRHFKKLAC